MAAAVAVAAGLDRAVLGDAGLLAEARQGIIFAEEADDRAALARLAHDGGRDAGDILGDAEALGLQLGGVLRAGADLGVADLGHAPDAVGEFDEAA